MLKKSFLALVVVFAIIFSLRVVSVCAEYVRAYSIQAFSFVYAKNGVCHQHTNRVLYQSGQTLPISVRGYSSSRWQYGITGDVGPEYGRFSGHTEYRVTRKVWLL